MVARTVVVALDNSQLALYALSWTLTHVFDPSHDTLELLHVVKLPEEQQSENSDYCIITMPKSPTSLIKSLLQRSTEQAANILNQGKAVVNKAYPNQAIICQTNVVYNNSVPNGILDFVHKLSQSSILVLGKQDSLRVMDKSSYLHSNDNTVKFCIHNA